MNRDVQNFIEALNKVLLKDLDEVFTKTNELQTNFALEALENAKDTINKMQNRIRTMQASRGSVSVSAAASSEPSGIPPAPPPPTDFPSATTGGWKPSTHTPRSTAVSAAATPDKGQKGSGERPPLKKITSAELAKKSTQLKHVAPAEKQTAQAASSASVAATPATSASKANPLVSGVAALAAQMKAKRDSAASSAALTGKGKGSPEIKPEQAQQKFPQLRKTSVSAAQPAAKPEAAGNKEPAARFGVTLRSKTPPTPTTPPKTPTVGPAASPPSPNMGPRKNPSKQ